MTFDQYEEKYFIDLEHGEARCRGIRNAINEANERQEVESALELYNEFIEENHIYCDGYDATILFPEYLALFEAHTEFHEEAKMNLMWAYKFLVGGIMDFYQIPFSQIESIYSDYEKFCRRFGFNLRSFYRQMWNSMYWHGLGSFAGIGSIADCHKKMMECPIDKLSEIPAGECDDNTKYILFVEKDIEKAFKVAEPILSGELSCPQVPLYTYINFAIYYFEAGDLGNAKKYISMAWRIMNRNYGSVDSYAFDKSFCMMIYSYIDVKKAIQMFRRQLLLCSRNTCGRDIFYLDLSGYHVFMQLEAAGQETIHFHLPFKDADIYNDENFYNVSELKDFFYQRAKSTADKFDARNSNTHFNDVLNKRYDFQEKTQEEKTQ